MSKSRTPPPFLRRHWKWFAVLAAIVALPFLPIIFKLTALAIPLTFVVLLPIGIKQHFQQARAIADTPTSTIRAAVQGYVELKGSSPSIGPGPLSGRPASLWRLEATCHSKQAGRKVVLESLSGGAPAAFLPLNDGTGTCLISLADAELDGVTTRKEAMPREQRLVLAPFFREEDRETLERDGDWVFEEIRLPAGSRLYAMGRFSSCTTTEDPRDLDWTQAVLQRGAKVPKTVRRLAREALKAAQSTVEERTAEWARLARDVEGIADDAPLQGTARLSVLTRDYEARPIRPLLLSCRSESEVSQERFVGVLGLGLGWLASIGFTVYAAWQAFPETTAALAGLMGFVSVPGP